MCEEESTKEEMNQRAEDLADQLANMSEAKKEEAMTEIENVEKSK